jgi:hydroxypyruvate isomerase
MNRRSFTRQALGAVSACALAGMPWVAQYTKSRRKTFPLHYAPHPGMFVHHAGEDIADQIRFAAEQGFTAWEDNDMGRRPASEQERLAHVMRQNEIRMGVFVANHIHWDYPNLTSGDEAQRTTFLKEIEASVDTAKRVRAQWMTVVPGGRHARLQEGYQTAHVVESLKRAAANLEPHGLVMVLEPLNAIDHPGMFLTRAAQAYQICKAVNSPSCKILYDVYHQQITEGDLIRNIEASWDEIAYFQVGDNPGRKEPTTGEINYRNIMRFLALKGYDGIIGMEHGSYLPGKEGEHAIIEAYHTISQFE